MRFFYIQARRNQNENYFSGRQRKEYPKAVSPLEIAEEISASLAKSVYAKINGMDYDLSRLIDFDATVELVTMDKPEALDVLRHSCSHLMASAIKAFIPALNSASARRLRKVFIMTLTRARA